MSKIFMVVSSVYIASAVVCFFVTCRSIKRSDKVARKYMADKYGLTTEQVNEVFKKVPKFSFLNNIKTSILASLTPIINLILVMDYCFDPTNYDNLKNYYINYIDNELDIKIK